MIDSSFLKTIGMKAKLAAAAMALATEEQKNEVLKSLADAISQEGATILKANRVDVHEAKAAGMSLSLLDRLQLEGRLKGISDDVSSIIALKDPVGEIFEGKTLPNGLKVFKRRTPIGVIGVIYEARPNVTVDVAALVIKSGNAAILRGGSETLHSNKALVSIIQSVLKKHGLPVDAIQYIENPDRSYVLELLHLHDYVDMIIPRGGAGLHEFCRENSRIPVITGGIGICHLFADDSADQDKSLEVIHNAKTQRPTVCNALDTLLVHANIADVFIPKVIERLGKSGVELRLDPLALKTVKQPSPFVHAAHPQDWDNEWLKLILGIKVVSTLDEAIGHIKKHSTGHSDGILTENQNNAMRFCSEVDSAAVYVNASTRFTDGSQLGLGAEVAISTQKLHARGPMGLKELTTYKWIVIGDYQIRT